jgi:hypothetical protein
MPERWSFAELAMEAMFQNTQANALRAGVVLTREEFWHTPGQLMVFPHGYLQLLRAGVTDIGLAQQFRRPADKLGIMKNGRN